MELKKFIENFANQFDETELSDFSEKTNFKELDEWSSMLALAIIAMVDEEYDVRVNGDDIRNSVSIEDLYLIVKSRL